MVKHFDARRFVSCANHLPTSCVLLILLIDSQNMGQNCVGIERILVQEDQYDELYEILSDRVKKLRTGSVLTPTPEGYINTVDCGSMINSHRFGGLEKVIADAADAGCQVEGVGDSAGQEYRHQQLGTGYYFTPTIVGPVTRDMEVANVERAFLFNETYLNLDP
jgi:acyl-CoA reductase-like NAD-dependent aldehyde dehydrogenase